MKLTPKQLEVVTSVRGHYVVLAGPGCGKTLAITEKIRYLFSNEIVPEPYSVLALTFTDSAARVMRSRLREGGFRDWSRTWVGTFHAFGHYILSSHGGNIGVREDYEIIDEKSRVEIIKQSIEMHNFSLLPWDESRRIDRLKRKGIYPGDCDEDVSEAARIVYQDYQECLGKMGALDLGDLVPLAVRLLKQTDFVRRAYTESFQYVIVDEFQDTDEQQLELVRLLAEQAIGSTVVGDDDQSIFGWRGALRENVSSIKAILHSSEIVMGANFRSDQVIVEAAEKVIAQDPFRKKKEIVPVSDKRGRLFKMGFPSYTAEAEAIASWIERIIVKKELEDLGDMAVITRTHQRARDVVKSLSERRIPWFEVSRLESRDGWETVLSLSILMLACDTSSGLYLHNVMKALEDCGFNFSLQREGALPVAIRISEALEGAHLPTTDYSHCSEILDVAGMTDLVERACSGSNDRVRRWNNISSLLRDITRVSSDGLTLFESLERLSGRRAVQILSGHAAKGTEFDIVFLAGLEDGVIPDYRSSSNDELLAEERRIFYVGLTRARKDCYMTYSVQKTTKGRIYGLKPSRFIELIPAGFFSVPPSE